ncbi:DUF305 domain-containing protein [Spirosoma sp.]|uniref:DUF305 domain-containing protein n=1 Tax=Spirosoma sp. TaxID=1899569 RepID=UPI003B3AC29A
MRKGTICLLAFLLSAAITGVFAQKVPVADSSKAGKATDQPLKIDLLPSVQQMIAKMKKLKLTGDPDIDYVAQARLHMQGTQELLKGIIDAQSDSALTQAAKTMLSTAETDLATIDKLQNELKPVKPNTAFVKQQKQVIAAISEKIKQSASSYKLTQNPWANMAILLSDQRQDAINLATSYLQFGKNTELRNFAQQSVEKAKLDLDIIKNIGKR